MPHSMTASNPTGSPPRTAATSMCLPLVRTVARTPLETTVRLPCMTRSTEIPADAAPNPHATAEQVAAARQDSKLAQVLYHDWEAESYDETWSISYDQRCIAYARHCFDGAAPDAEITGL